VVHHIYDWLPGYGETSVAVRATSSDAVIEVIYDDPSGTGALKREIQFGRVCCFYQASFPWPTTMPIVLEPRATLGALVEFPESDAARQWTEHFGAGRVVKHFGVWFLSENLTIQVFAESFRVSDASRHLAA